jgi:hypothetical protein
MARWKTAFLRNFSRSPLTWISSYRSGSTHHALLLFSASFIQRYYRQELSGFYFRRKVHLKRVCSENYFSQKHV